MRSAIKKFGMWFPVVYAYRAVRTVIKKCGPLLFLVVFVLGITLYEAYYRQYYPGKAVAGSFWGALYSTIRVFTFSVDLDASKISGDVSILFGIVLSEKVFRILFEILRFIAPLFTGFALAKLLKPFFADFCTWIRVRLPFYHCIVAHTSPAVKAALKKTSENYDIVSAGTGSCFHAKRHIIAMEDDAETLRYYEDNVRRFRRGKSMVYLCMMSPRWTEPREDRLIVSNITENCARGYWEKYYLNRPVEKAAKIVLIGFGVYGEAVFNQSLLVNVFLQNEPGVEYHVFGDASDYLKRQKDLFEAMPHPFENDRICFHAYDEYLSDRAAYEGADRVVIVGDDDRENCRVFENLMLQFTELPVIHIRLKSRKMLRSLYPAQRDDAGNANETCAKIFTMTVHYAVFGTDEELYSENAILKEELLVKAKKLLELYENTEVKKERKKGNEETSPKSWLKADMFSRKSNIASADHLSVKMRLACGTEDPEKYRAWYRETVKQIPAEKGSICYRYQEMEHVRWSRFELLYGIRYDKEKNIALKHHSNLLPFETLDQETRDKDWQAFEMFYRCLGGDQ